jgi:hypothetical protein
VEIGPYRDAIGAEGIPLIEFIEPNEKKRKEGEKAGTDQKEPKGMSSADQEAELDDELGEGSQEGSEEVYKDEL